MTKLKKYSLEEHFELGPGKVLSSLGKQNRVPGAFYSFDDINVFKDKKICYSQKQQQFDFEKGLIESKKYSGFFESKTKKTDWDNLFSVF